MGSSNPRPSEAASSAAPPTLLRRDQAKQCQTPQPSTATPHPIHSPPFPPSSPNPPHSGFRSGGERGSAGFPQTPDPSAKLPLRHLPRHSYSCSTPIPYRKVAPRNAHTSSRPPSHLPKRKNRGNRTCLTTQPSKKEAIQYRKIFIGTNKRIETRALPGSSCK